MNRNFIIIGASRGIGLAIAQYLVAEGDNVISVSRSESISGTWIKADVTTDMGVNAVKAELGNKPIDGLLFIAGIWEESAFTENYNFLSSSRNEIRKIIELNLVSPIILAHALAENLSQASSPRILLMGSTSGLDNYSPEEVAYTASKFGLRGVAQSLSIALRSHGIGVSLINPGDVATPEVVEHRKSQDIPLTSLIPLADVIRTVQFVLETSSDCIPSEINLIEKKP